MDNKNNKANAQIVLSLANIFVYILIMLMNEK